MENMDNNSIWEENKPMMINELTQGKDLVKQLGIHLDPATSPTGELLISKILSSIENVLSMLNSGSSSSEGATTTAAELSHQLTGVTAAAAMGVESPRSVSGSPRSDDFDPMMMGGDKSKKRKMLPRWTEQVRISSEKGPEGPVDDGYGWRKYGQKEILGAKHPRGYYRCTHRNVQGCLATKQVQRSDEDPSMFSITYRGRHTCIQTSHLHSLQSPKKRSNQGGHHGQKQEQQQQQVEQKSAQEIIMNFRTGLEVKTEDLDTRADFFRCSSFSFPTSTSTMGGGGGGCLENENHIFSSLTPENNFMGNFSPSFISPTTTSESNYYSPYRMNGGFGGGHNLQTTSESDLNEIISAATSTTNSPMIDLDFSLDPVDFYSHFPFDSPDFFN